MIALVTFKGLQMGAYLSLSPIVNARQKPRHLKSECKFL